jgi:hypothetical protein
MTLNQFCNNDIESHCCNAFGNIVASDTIAAVVIPFVALLARDTA